MTLKEFREKYKLTQTDICLKCDISLSTSRAWEKGYGKPTGERKEKLEELFESYDETYEE